MRIVSEVALKRNHRKIKMGFNGRDIKSRRVGQKSKMKITYILSKMGGKEISFISIYIGEKREKTTENDEDNQRKRKENKTKSKQYICKK